MSALPVRIGSKNEAAAAQALDAGCGARCRHRRNCRTSWARLRPREQR